MESTSGTIVPSGSWSENVPSVTPGNFLWTRTQLTFNDGSTVTSYSVSRYGIDGTGAVSSVNGQSPDTNGNVSLTANNVPTADNLSIQAHITAAEDDIDTLQSDMTTAQAALDNLCLKATSVVTVSGNGTTTHTLTGLTADHEISNWGMFTDAALTTPIPSNNPTCDVTITPGAGSWTLLIENFSATFYIRPTFILPQN
jgi:hypothetical protein